MGIIGLNFSESLGVEKEVAQMSVVGNLTDDQIFSAFRAGDTDVIKAVLQNLSPLSVVSAGNLPTADPHVVGQVWSNSGVLTVSAG